ncbi:MAG: fumarylacetoacetase [Caulobacteraceae bacterium]|nr:fumarylacetoacetase [Caulobacteraceae bacterium]
MIDETHDPARLSFVASANGHPDFPIQNLPFGVFSPAGAAPRGGVAIGDQVLDLSEAAASPLLSGDAQLAAAACGGQLNDLLALPPQARRDLRRQLSTLLVKGSEHAQTVSAWLHPAALCELHPPARIGDYTDFYAGIHHALNVGRQFRPDQPLLPNYKHMPIAYHGRASSIRVSGAPVFRPSGQRKAPDRDTPDFGPSERLDFELELGVWIGGENALGSPVPIAEAGRRVAGLCLLNDWSARDLQTWEYQPLGPFLAKNFLTTISPWIITAEALEPFRIAAQARAPSDPQPLPYLWDAQDQAHGGFSIILGVLLRTQGMRERAEPPVKISHGSARHLYWTAAQMVAHHTAGGCDLRPGDLFGTGTVSTPDDEGLGSLLEMTRGGRAPLHLPGGETRGFLEDGDEVSLTGRAEAEGFVGIGFGPCVGTVRISTLGVS